jgi:glycosyltransferase involved in cell wall biosynthesis
MESTKNNKKSNINISVIIPIYNVEEYLPECIESVLNQGELRFEVILVNDGSTDRSGAIIDQYAQRDSRIKAIHKENGGASSARNVALDLAKGEYIAFIDSDDWVKENSLSELYGEAVKYQADVVMGNLWYHHKDGSIDNPFQPVPKAIRNQPLLGKDCFCLMVKTKSYAPMAVNYIYHRRLIEKIQIRFEEGIMAEDELWTPIVLCQAEKMVVTDTDFYYYRQQETSVMHTTNLLRRLKSIFRVTDRLMTFISRYDFSGENNELKNWFYVNIFNLYSKAFSLLASVKDSSYQLPEHRLDCFWKDSWEMIPLPQKICKNYFRVAKAGLDKYTDWRTSEWVASVAPRIKTGNKKLLLIFNTPLNKDLSLTIEDVPANWVITTDQRYLKQADTVVFHLPNLYGELNCDLDKREGQIWVAWCMESEKNYPLIADPEIKDLFDLWMSYMKDAGIIYPYYRYEYIELLSRQSMNEHKQNKICMSFFDPVSESIHEQYLTELKKYLEIDSYGNLHNDQELPEQVRNRIILSQTHKLSEDDKMSYYRKYQFVIAFENAIEPDFVTDKFFYPLLAGSVPIYFGAPNIEDFAPGDNCFIDVRQFDNPQSLAQFIHTCCEDEQLYAKFFEWKHQSLRKSFVKKVEEQKEHPLVRLCRKIDRVFSMRAKN